MSKAEERALEKYPIEMYEEVGWRCVDKNTHKRQYFIEGYHQAEKDLELSWADIKLIIDIVDSESLKPHLFDEIDYQEVLKRFKEMKGE